MNSLLNYDELLALIVHSIKTNDLYTALNICKSSELLVHPDQRLNFMHAAILNQLGLYEEAISIYKVVLESEPNNELAVFQLGSAYLFSGHIDEAKLVWKDNLYFEDAIRGFIHLTDEEPVEAKSCFELFIEENNKYPELNPDLISLCQSVENNINKMNEDELIDNSAEVQSKNDLDDSKVDALLSVYKSNY